MRYQTGFTLFELMIAIAVIAILSAMAVPAYQGYIQKAALTDVLSTLSQYRMAIELCYLEQGSAGECHSGVHGVPNVKTTRYIKTLSVSQGQIAITGQNALQGLSLTLTPSADNLSGELVWRRRCLSETSQRSLADACNATFRFADEG